MIPKTIHQMWVGSEVPAHIATYTETWRNLHPDWEFLFWDEETIVGLGLANRDLYQNAHAIAPRAPAQFAADVVRYEVLYSYGGVWVDADFECQRPIDGLIGGLTDLTGWLVWEVEGIWLNNAIMAMPAGHSLMRDAIDKLPANIEAKEPATNSVLSGPQFITPLALTTTDPVMYLPKDYFYPYLWNELDRGGESFPDAFAVHHWNNQRTRRNKPR